MEEIVKQIPDYPDYHISNTGKIYSSRYHWLSNKDKSIKEMRPWKCTNGYLEVYLINDNGKSVKLIHRLVAQSFIPNPGNKETVNHIDGMRDNNHFTNLEWNTIGENIQHSYNNFERKSLKGSGHPSSRCVIVTKIDTGEDLEYACLREACEAHNASYRIWVNRLYRNSKKVDNIRIRFKD